MDVGERIFDGQQSIFILHSTLTMNGEDVLMKFENPQIFTVTTMDFSHMMFQQMKKHNFHLQQFICLHLMMLAYLATGMMAQMKVDSN